MPITEADIEKIAQLAHLEITDDERRLFAPQISEIVTYVEQLDAVDTSAVEPALGGLTPEGEQTASWRKEVEQPTLKSLHADSSLNLVKLAQFRKLSNERLIDSLKAGQACSLKARPDGTLIEGHHRIKVLRE